jgi:putative two-component system response regulator
MHPNTPNPKRPTVLIVDDHATNLSGLRAFLQRDYSVLTTADGSEAVAIARTGLPDTVLLDVLLPGASGLDVCAALKQHEETRLIPVVLMSGSIDRQTRIAAIAAGADDFLGKPLDCQELGARVRALVRLKRMTDELESAEALVLTLGRVIEARDPCTEGHCDRLATYATTLGARLGLDGDVLDTLTRGAFLHDIGKIAVPDRLLLKKSRLTSGEYEVMKSHPIIGDDLCRPVKSLEAVRPIVRHHHERLDGTGYPDGLAGNAIPLVAQIVTVVDVFDALTSDRPYRRALAPRSAFRVMREEAKNGAYSSELVEQLADLQQSGAICVPQQTRRGGTARTRASGGTKRGGVGRTLGQVG